MAYDVHKCKVGELRPSQVLFTFGVGAVVDLPYLSVMVMGLEDWPTAPDQEINEPRLLGAVCKRLNTRVQKLLAPPVAPDAGPFDDGALIGVPIAPFPRWLVCPHCRRLARIDSGLFELKHNAYHPEQTRYVHTNCQKQGKPPAVMPARFLVACENGHLDDFPWVEFVHHGPTNCNSILTLREFGISGEAADVEVACMTCGSKRRMADAFGERGKANLQKCSGGCSGRRPHLRDYEQEGCDRNRVCILLGASNSWFPVTLSAISIPSATDKLAQLVEGYWADLKDAESEQNIKLIRRFIPAFATYSDAEVWVAVENRKSGNAGDADSTDLKTPEWEAFSNPSVDKNARDFRLTVVPPPTKYQAYFEKVVKVERLREVRSLTGFTRIDYPGDNSEIDLPEVNVAPLSRSNPLWVPTVEVRGEGIFIQFSESSIEDWLDRVSRRDHEFATAHARWRAARGLEPAQAGYLGARFILLHSFAHALMRQLSLECGYTAASIRERIYSFYGGQGKGAMAGILIYTAAPDSEGTLGGLVGLADPVPLERHIDQALEQARLCASDPLCAEHHPLQNGLSLHGAACHACLFAPETSCEKGNRYLDRSFLVETFEEKNFAFFKQAS